MQTLAENRRHDLEETYKKLEHQGVHSETPDL